MTNKQQYQGKNAQSSDNYMESVEREITRAVINGTIEIVNDDDDANSADNE